MKFKLKQMEIAVKVNKVKTRLKALKEQLRS